MTYSQFVAKYLGRYKDYDGAYGYQCVDLMRAYINEVYGLNPYLAVPTTGNAKNIFNNFRTNQYFEKIKNTPNGIPAIGDIAFLGTYPGVTGLAGHVGIVDSANLYNLVLFNQNYPTNSPCNFRRFNYVGKFNAPIIIGWLKRRK